MEVTARKKLPRKIFVMTCIILVQAVFLYAYYEKQDAISSLKIIHLVKNYTEENNIRLVPVLLFDNLVASAGTFLEGDSFANNDTPKIDELNKTLPYKDELDENRGWITNWEQYTISEGILTVGAGAMGTSVFTFLDGTQLWQNYIFTSKINVIEGEAFSLVARMKDDANYTSCIFSDEYIKIEQVVNGKKEILAEWYDELNFEMRDISAGISIDENIVDCYLNGERALSSFELSPELDSGGIGFKTWNSEINNSKIVIDGITVNQI